MKVQRASYEIRTAKLATTFGEEMAARWYTPAQLAVVPRFVSGKNKGKMKGTIEWKKVRVGGWQRDKNGVGGVQYPGTRDVAILYTEPGTGYTRRYASAGRVEDQAEADRRWAEHCAAVRDEITAALRQGSD